MLWSGRSCWESQLLWCPHTTQGAKVSVGLTAQTQHIRPQGFKEPVCPPPVFRWKDRCPEEKSDPPKATRGVAG